MKFASIPITIGAFLLAGALLSSVDLAWTKEAQGANQQVQPLANLDKMLRQANGVKVDAIVDNKLASNVTNALNDMAQNLRKMFVENRRLTMQVQDLIGRVQNVTGVNATNALGTIQQQAANMSNASSFGGLNGLNGQMNMGSLLQRFGGQ